MITGARSENNKRQAEAEGHRVCVCVGGGGQKWGTGPLRTAAHSPYCTALHTCLEHVSQLKRTRSGKPSTGCRCALSQAMVLASWG